MNIDNITTSYVFLSWLIPAGNRSSYGIEVLGIPPKNLTVYSESVLVDQLVPGNYYIFSIFAIAGNGLTGKTTVTSTFTVPDVIENITKDNITTNSVFLSWTHPAGNRSSYGLEVLGIPSKNLTVYSESVLVDQLVPGNYYTFSIFVISGNDLTGNKTVTSTNTVPGEVKDLTAPTITTSSVLLEWQPPEGNTSSYLIQNLGNATISDPVTMNSITIANLTPGNYYTFLVSALVGENNLTGKSSSIPLYTRPGNVTILKVSKVNTSSLYVSWLPSEGNRSSYLVEVLGDPPQSFNVISESVTITNLTQRNQYTVRICAVSGEHDLRGSGSDMSVILSDILSSTDVSTSSVRLVWELREGQQISYRINVDGIPTSNWSGTSQEALIEGLIPGNLYTFQISAYEGNNFLYGYESEISLNTRPEVVRDVHLDNVSTSSVDLSWLPPVGNHSFYRIEVTGNSSQNLTTTSESLSIQGLIPGNMYTFMISAVAGGDVQGARYENSTFTKPDVVRNLNISATTTTDVALTWDPPQGGRRLYQIEVIGASAQNVTSSTESMSINNLIPGSEYTFFVSAVVGDNNFQGDPTNVSGITIPDVINNMNIDNITTNSVFLSWTHPAGNRSSYGLEVLGIPSKNLTVYSESVLVDQLVPGNYYTFSIFAIAGNGLSGLTTVNSTFTVPDVIDIMNIDNITTNSVFLSWTHPAGNRSSYGIEVLGIPSKNLTVYSESVLVDELVPGNYYTFSISAIAGNGLTGKTTVTSTFTVPDVIDIMNIDNITTNSVFLSWPIPAGNRSSYGLEVLGFPSKNLTVYSESVLVDQLVPGNYYTFSIFAIAGNGLTGKTTVTSTFTVPDVIGNITKDNITTNSVFLSWTHPAGNRSSYGLEVLGIPSKNLTVYSESVLVDQLVPGNFYTFSIFAISGNGLTGNKTVTSTNTVPGEVKDLTAPTITTSSVLLEWQPPEGNTSSYLIQNLGNATINDPVTMNSITIANLTPGNYYTFLVSALVGENNLTGQSSSIPLYTRPGNVTILKVSKVNISSLYVSWLPSEGNRSSYLVEVLGDPPQSFNVISESVTITNLTQRNQYTVRICAVSGEHDLRGSGSDMSVILSDILSSTDVSTSSVRLVWELREGQQISYRINVDGIPTSNWSGTSQEALIEGLIPGNLYTFQISAYEGNNFLYGYESEISLYTRPEVVRDVHLDNVSTSSVDLSWLPPVGNHSFYRIEVTGNSSQNLTTTSESLSIQGLIPGNMYTFMISAVAGGDVQGARYEYSTFTKPDVVRNLNISATTTTDVTLTWDPPQGGRRLYQIEVIGASAQNLTSSTESMSISNLTPGSEYTFFVSAVVGDNNFQGDPTNVSGITIPDVINNMNIDNITTNSVFLSWTHPAGNRSSYGIEVLGIPSKNLTVYSESVLVDDLVPGNYYTFSIFAIAGNGLSGLTTVNSTFTVPDVIDIMNIDNITTNSVFLSWTHPAGNRSSYGLEVLGIPSKNLTVYSESAFVDQLVPGNYYTFSIFAIAGNGLTGKTTVASTFTVPDFIGNMSIDNITISSVILSWPIPAGNRSSYGVEVLGIPSKNLTVYSESVLVDELVPGNYYTFSIFAIAGNGLSGLPTVNSTFTVPDVIDIMNIDNITTNSVFLSWPIPAGNRSSYGIEVLGIPPKNLTVYSESVLVDQLVPGNYYTFSIFAIAGNGLTGKTTVTSTFTVPDVIRNMNIDNITTNSVFLSWTHPAGNRSSYGLEVLGIPSKNLTVYSESVLVDQLVPGNFYTFSIFAISGNGLTGNTTVNSTFTEPESVTSLTVGDVTLSSVSLSWAAPPGNRSSYLIEVLGDPSLNEIVTSESATVGSLSAGRRYTFIVSALSGDNIVKGSSTHISASTYSSSLFVSLRFSTSESDRKQMIMAQITRLLRDKFPGQNVTAAWKRETKIN
ncbi:receptor-type tyrosine-protein phosphatase beta-like isoform X2 [Ascaphus truei]|uniref:receptor-type tyrosine-protein phosphatase beta-like isoform X2 n=1 Tax=Ascaphus truei TaxID=8439 RepID=UPI003F598391